ncbi:MAG TPA: hypothetical protein VHA15_15840 [Burkholderiales bacterium]|jgi:hypothetical protein|nr:hypothetical protein [Burkholderiales bacterium]
MWWLAAVLVPAAITVWIAGQFVRARREARESVLRRGTVTSAEVVAVHGRRLEYRFAAPGWPQPIVGRGESPPGRRFEPGERIRVRYLPRHPHVCAIDPVAGEGP